MSHMVGIIALPATVLTFQALFGLEQVAGWANALPTVFI